MVFAYMKRRAARRWRASTVSTSSIASAGGGCLHSSAMRALRASWLKPSLRANGIDPDQLAAAPPPRSYDSNDVEKTKRWREIWAAGQGVGAVKSVQPVAQIVSDLRCEYLAAGERFGSRLRQGASPPVMQSKEPAYE